MDGIKNNDKKNILISVVITNYNRSIKCFRAISSVLNQTLTDIECIVVDDCSSDNSLEIFKQIKDSRFKVLALDNNIGQAGAINKGVEVAQSDWVAFLDSDDYWAVNKLYLQYNQIVETKGLFGIYYCASEILYVNGQKRKIAATYNGHVYEKELYINVIGITSRVIVKKCCFKEVGGFDTNLIICRDWDCWLRISKLYPVMNLNQPLVLYEETTDAASSDVERVIVGRKLFWKKHFGDNPNLLVRRKLNYIFFKFLLSRGFTHRTRQLCVQALHTELYFKYFLICLLTFVPTRILVTGLSKIQNK
jgi:glycosyltransferase involved in cell wall biosynthesis